MAISMYLKNKVALITGSSGGIGKQIALDLAGLGAKTAVNYRTEKKGVLSVKSEIETAGGICSLYKADVTDNSQVEEMFKKIEQDLGPVSVLINNVGSFAIKPLIEYSVEEWNELISSNLSSAFYCSRRAVNSMKEPGEGQIINIGFASADKVKASPNIGPYAAAKTGLLVFTKTLSRELLKDNIRVNSVSPGLMDNGKLSREMEKKTIRMAPGGKLGTPKDISNAVCFLLKPESNYITGANIIVSAGWEV